MTFFSIVVFSLIPLFFWHTILGSLYPAFFSCSIVDGKYFSYQPDVFEKNFYIYRAAIFWKNSLRYLFGIERPQMPLYLKVFVFISGIANIGGWTLFLIAGLGYYGFIDLEALMGLDNSK